MLRIHLHNSLLYIRCQYTVVTLFIIVRRCHLTCPWRATPPTVHPAAGFSTHGSHWVKPYTTPPRSDKSSWMRNNSSVRGYASPASSEQRCPNILSHSPTQN